jgi:hypothetical protein
MNNRHLVFTIIIQGKNLGFILAWALYLKLHHLGNIVKAHPITGHEGPEGQDRYSSTLSLTSALDEGGSTPRPGPLYPRDTEPLPIV